MQPKKEIYILGINCFSHNSSASLIKNGEIIFQLEEERFDRKKYSPNFPIKSIRAGLKKAGISISQVTRITFFIQPWKEIFGNLGHFVKFFPKTLNLFSSPLGGSAELGVFQRFYKCMTLRSEFKKYFPGESIPKVQFVKHHLAHAASCFFLSPFEESAILIMDGRGESSTALLAVGKGNEIRTLHEIKVPHSIGHFYAAMTDYLGFKPFYDEWKVMGMTAYGKPVYVEEFRQILMSQKLGFSLDLSYFNFHLFGPKKWFSDKFIEVFGVKRLNTEELTQNHFDIAKSFQIVVEEVAVELTKQLKEMSSCENLCLAGGVVLNILMNAEIIHKSGFKNFFFQPIATDSGTSLGSAVYSYNKTYNQPRDIKFWSPYLGLEYSQIEIEECLAENDLRFEQIDENYSLVAKLIHSGKIVGWFQGAMEAGPRSLGNRAILADPRSLVVKDQLNLRIKHREKFRPFAPSVTEEDTDKYFDMPLKQNSPYMMISGSTKLEWASLIPAVTHVDGSARVHTVNQKMNPRFWKLLKEFEKLTGIPILLNTSFNEQEPIVENPQQAINCYLRTDMDALVIGNFLVVKAAK